MDERRFGDVFRQRRGQHAIEINVAEGLRYMGYKDDHEVNAIEWIVYDALCAYCHEMVRQGKMNGDFKA